MKKDIGIEATIAHQIRTIYNQIRGLMPASSPRRFLMPKGTTFEIPPLVSDAYLAAGNISNGSTALKQAQSLLWGSSGMFTAPSEKITLDRRLFFSVETRSTSNTTDPVFSSSGQYSEGIISNDSTVTLNGTTYRKGVEAFSLDTEYSSTDRSAEGFFVTNGTQASYTSRAIITKVTTLNDVFVDRGALSLFKPSSTLRFTLNHGASNRVARFVGLNDTPALSLYYCGGIPATAANYNDFFVSIAHPINYFLTTATVGGKPITGSTVTSVNVDHTTGIGIGRSDRTWRVTLVSGASSIYILNFDFRSVISGWIANRSNARSYPAAVAFNTAHRINRGQSGSFNNNRAFISGHPIILIPTTETATSSVIEVTRI